LLIETLRGWPILVFREVELLRGQMTDLRKRRNKNKKEE